MKLALRFLAGALALCAAGFIASAAAPWLSDGVASFDAKGNPSKATPDDEGSWAFNDGSSAVVFGPKEKGVIPGVLTMNGPEFIPWAASEMGGDSPFHGDLRARGVSQLAFDARTVFFGGGFCLPAHLENIPMSIEMRNDGGTPDSPFDDCSVLTTLGAVPQVGEGWVSYATPLDVESPTLPAGWAVSGTGNGCEGMSPDEAWNWVVEDVSQIRICWEQCDFLRIECIWELEIDNIAID